MATVYSLWIPIAFLDDQLIEARELLVRDNP
jgi:hypothetical protein